MHIFLTHEEYEQMKKLTECAAIEGHAGGNFTASTWGNSNQAIYVEKAGLQIRLSRA